MRTLDGDATARPFDPAVVSDQLIVVESAGHPGT
jgi:hypothetical protein